MRRYSLARNIYALPARLARDNLHYPITTGDFAIYFATQSAIWFRFHVIERLLRAGASRCPAAPAHGIMKIARSSGAIWYWLSLRAAHALQRYKALPSGLYADFLNSQGHSLIGHCRLVMIYISSRRFRISPQRWCRAPARTFEGGTRQ